MSATTLAIQNSLQYEFQGTTPSPYPTTWYVGLSTSLIDNDGDGAVEPPQLANYERVAGTWSFDSGSSVITNSVEVKFPVSSDNWGAIQEVFLASGSVSNPSTSDIWYHFVLPESIPISGNMLYKIPANVIQISMYQ